MLLVSAFDVLFAAVVEAPQGGNDLVPAETLDVSLP